MAGDTKTKPRGKRKTIRPDDYLPGYGSVYRQMRARLNEVTTGERVGAANDTFQALSYVVVEHRGSPPPLSNLKTLATGCGHRDDRLLRAHLPLLEKAGLVCRRDDGSWSTPLADMELARRTADDDGPSGAEPGSDETRPKPKPSPDQDPPEIGPNPAEPPSDLGPSPNQARTDLGRSENANENNDGGSPLTTPSASSPPESYTNPCPTPLTPSPSKVSPQRDAGAQVSAWAIELVLEHIDDPALVERIARDVAGHGNVRDINAVFRTRMERDYGIHVTDTVWKEARKRSLEVAA